MVKPRLYGDNLSSKETAEKVLLYVLKHIETVASFIPYITEEI